MCLSQALLVLKGRSIVELKGMDEGKRISDCYNQVDGFLAEAESAVSEEDFHRLLTGAQQVLTRLMTSLDLSGTNAMASNLYRIYDFMDYRLAQADAAFDVGGATEVRGLLKDLKKAIS